MSFSTGPPVLPGRPPGVVGRIFRPLGIVEETGLRPLEVEVGPPGVALDLPLPPPPPPPPPHINVVRLVNRVIRTSDYTTCVLGLNLVY